MYLVSIYKKKMKNNDEIDGFQLSKAHLIHTYDPQSNQTTNSTQAKKNHGTGTILGRGRQSDFYSTVTELLNVGSFLVLTSTHNLVKSRALECGMTRA